jgi:serine/threonine protein kinase
VNNCCLPAGLRLLDFCLLTIPFPFLLFVPLSLQEAGDDTSVKIAAFAFAKKVTNEKSLKTLCGTAQYVAPEILDTNIKYYDQRCDLWSLGVFAYVLLGGYPPFEGILEDLAKEIMRGHFEFHDEYWSEISQSAKEMIASLLVVRPEKRISAEQALSCKWMEMEDEKLILRDLSVAQASIRKTLQPKDKVKMAVQTVSGLEWMVVGHCGVFST